MRPLRTDVVDTFDGLRDDWDALAVATRNVFSTWEWASVWWRHLGAGRELRIGRCTDPEGRVIAILPLFAERRAGLRVLRFLGVGPADELGPVCHPDDRPSVAHALIAQADLLGADLVLGEVHRAEADWCRLLGARRVDREESPTIILAGRSWDEYAAGRGRTFRRRLPNMERKLRAEHQLTYTETAVSRLASDLDVLFALHAAQHDAQRSGFLRDAAFHRAFAGEALDRGWLRLRLLELMGEPAAATLEFVYASVVAGYQGGRSDAWPAFSLGHIIHMHALRESFAEGASEFRLLRGAEPWKRSLADEGASAGLETYALPRTTLGHVAAMAMAAAVATRHKGGEIRRRLAAGRRRG